MQAFEDDHAQRSKFQILSKKIKDCQKCPGLNLKGVTENAPGFGNIFSKVAIVGQSLCKPCMETQVPFTGGCGRLIDEALELAGIEKSDIFITNAVHCHTPLNRKSLPIEIANCREYLLEELEILRPTAIIALGKDATTSVLGEGSWPSLIGKRICHQSRTTYPCYHPAYMLRLGPLETTRYVESLAAILKFESRNHSFPLQEIP